LLILLLLLPFSHHRFLAGAHGLFLLFLLLLLLLLSHHRLLAGAYGLFLLLLLRLPLLLLHAFPHLFLRLPPLLWRLCP
jgi:hypothetical protein